MPLLYIVISYGTLNFCNYPFRIITKLVVPNTTESNARFTHSHDALRMPFVAHS